MSGYTTFLRTKWENFNGTTAASSPCQLRHEAGNTCLGERQERKQNGDTSHRYVESHPTRATKSVPRCLRAPRDGVGRHLASLSLSPLPLLALLETKARGSRRQNGSNGRTETTKDGDAVTRLTRISILSLTCAPHRGERATLSLDEGSERGGGLPGFGRRFAPTTREHQLRFSLEQWRGLKTAVPSSTR